MSLTAFKNGADTVQVERGNVSLNGGGFAKVEAQVGLPVDWQVVIAGTTGAATSNTTLKAAVTGKQLSLTRLTVSQNAAAAVATGVLVQIFDGLAGTEIFRRSYSSIEGFDMDFSRAPLIGTAGNALSITIGSPGASGIVEVSASGGAI